MTASTTTIHIVDHVQDMRTPAWLYAAACEIVNRGASFELDAFAGDEDTLCKQWHNKEDDGLVQPWKPRTFVNPPFRLMARVVDKAIEESTEHAVHVGLIGPAGCSQRWFHKLLVHADIYLPDKRINFLMPDGTPSSRAMADSAFYHVHGDVHRYAPVVRVLKVPR